MGAVRMLRRGGLRRRWRSLLLLTVLVSLDLAGLWGLLWLSLLAGVAIALDTPARLAFLVEMVGAEDLPPALLKLAVADLADEGEWAQLQQLIAHAGRLVGGSGSLVLELDTQLVGRVLHIFPA